MPLVMSELGLPANPDLVIWRYMSLEKFRSILKEKALFFCRADKFSDAFEGSIPKREAEHRPKAYKTAREFYGWSVNAGNEKKFLNTLEKAHLNKKKLLLVNCWHINNSENDAMWRLYMDNNDGVAMRTTVSALLRAFENTSEDVELGRVRYIDYEKDIWFDENEYPIKSYNMHTPIWHKRQEFVQEAELRLVHTLDYREKEIEEFWEKAHNQNGTFIPLNLASMELTVFTHPTSSDSHLNDIRSLVKISGLNFPTDKSVLSHSAFY